MGRFDAGTGPVSQRKARIQARKEVGRETERTQSWFDRGDTLAARAESGELVPELDGHYLDSASRRRRVAVAVAAAGVIAAAAVAALTVF